MARDELYFSFCSKKQLESKCYYSPLDGMLVHRRVPSMKQLGVLLLPPGLDASPSQGTQHEATKSIATLTFGLDASPSQCFPQQFVTMSVYLMVAGVHLLGDLRLDYEYEIIKVRV